MIVYQRYVTTVQNLVGPIQSSVHSHSQQFDTSNHITLSEFMLFGLRPGRTLRTYLNRMLIRQIKHGFKLCVLCMFTFKHQYRPAANRTLTLNFHRITFALILWVFIKNQIVFQMTFGENLFVIP